MANVILHSLARMNRGGAETLIMNIFRHIDKGRYNFHFLLNSDECDYADEIRKLGGKIYSIPGRSQGVLRYCNALDTFFSSHRGEFQAVHMHTSSLSSLELLYYAKKYGIKKRIIHSHNTAQTGIIHNILHYVQKPVLRYLATNYLSCSKVASDWLYRGTGVLSKSVVINNGIDLKQFEYNINSREEIRQFYNISDNTVVLGHVGRFDVVKNHSFLLDIFNEFHKINSDSVLICVGVGSLLEKCKKKAQELGIGDNVIFTGLQTEIFKYLSAFDFFIFPSLYEGLPVALVEAQASGLPTVVSDKVSPEAKLSNSLSFFPLEKSASDWARYIYTTNFTDRFSSLKQIEVNGYNIEKTVQYLENEIYL